MNIAYTKIDVKRYRAADAKFGYDKTLLNLLYDFHTDIGAVKELPNSREEGLSYLVRLHETIAVNNIIFPDDVRFEKIYADWMLDVVYERAPRKGNNISALARCFNEWYKINAINYIKAAPITYTNSSKKVEQFDNDTIQRQYQIIKMLNGNSIDSGLFATGGAKSYFKRIKQEYYTRFNESN
jgi:hypothetical protein